jgi:lactobin A/cerein 7B family class IIb bacteriocin
MNIISDKELKIINGGAISFGTALIIGGIVTFLIGVLDGFVRPLRCR